MSQSGMKANLQLAEGHVIDGYQVIQAIEAGGMGEVYLVRNLSLGRQEALKLLKPALSTDPDLVNRFLAEARRAASLDHPHIVPIYHVGSPDGDLRYFTMKWVQGQSLRSLLSQGPMHESRIRHFLEQIAPAMDYAHGLGIVHRDIKPANLLIDDSDRVYLADFGIAKAEQDTLHTQTGMQIGTAAYMSPEQIQDAKSADGRSDLYSLGVVLYEMVTGRPPFEGDSQIALALQHVQTPPPDPTALVPGISPRLRDAILKLLAKRAEDRFQTGQDLLDALEPSQLVESRQSVQDLPRAAIAFPQKRTGLVVAGVILAVGMLGLALLGVHHHESKQASQVLVQHQAKVAASWALLVGAHMGFLQVVEQRSPLSEVTNANRRVRQEIEDQITKLKAAIPDFENRPPLSSLMTAMQGMVEIYDGISQILNAPEVDKNAEAEITAKLRQVEAHLKAVAEHIPGLEPSLPVNFAQFGNLRSNHAPTTPDRRSQAVQSDRYDPDALWIQAMKVSATLRQADGELNVIFHQLRRQLAPSQRRALETDELAWIRQRDQRCAPLRGDIPAYADCIEFETRSRTDELQRY